MMDWMIIILISLLLAAMFAAMELLFVSAVATRTEGDTGRQGMASRLENIFYDHEESYLTVVIVGENIFLVTFALSLAAALYAPLQAFFGGALPTVVLLIVIAAVALYLAIELMALLFSGANAQVVMRIMSPLSLLFYIVLYPFAWLVMAASNQWMRLTRVEAKPRRMGFMLSKVELDAFIQGNLENNTESTEVENEMKMLHNALDFSRVYVRDCMVPRTEIIAVDIDKETDDDLLQLLVETGKSKVVVYRGNIDNIEGYYHVAEMFRGGDWRKKVRPVLFVPESKPANKQMSLFMQQKKSMAIVVDEFGGTAGLVTLEDLVEEIFGEIEDEHDRTNLVSRRTAEGEYDFSGRMEISNINEVFGLQIPESDEYLTIAGYILNHYQTLPAQGETVTIGRFAFTITRRRANRIELIHLKIVGE